MCPPRRWRSWSIGATRRRSAPPSGGSSRGARPLACTPRQVRPSMSGVPSGVLRRLPIIAWTFVSGPTNRSRRTASRSKPARSLADAARCCARSEEHTSELQSLMRISYAVFCLKKKTKQQQKEKHHTKHKVQQTKDRENTQRKAH